MVSKLTNHFAVSGSNEYKNKIATKFINCTDISDFLSIWIKNKLLSKKEQNLLESYYRNYINNFSHRIRYFYQAQTQEVLSLIEKQTDLNILEVGKTPVDQFYEIAQLSH